MIPATLIPGDGIGPEIVESTVLVLDPLGAPFAWEVHQAGMSGVEAFGDPLPQITLDSIRRTRLALKGPLTTPVGGGYRSSNVRLREEFHLYANPTLDAQPGTAGQRRSADPESKKSAPPISEKLENANESWTRLCPSRPPVNRLP